MSAKGTKLRLLPREALVATGRFDHADWNYGRRLGWLQRKRFELVLALMGDARFERLLEIGYGSGVFMPELKTRCRALFGADPHPREREVGEVLAKHGVEATLASAGATELPFEDAMFDGVVTVSALEYVEDLPAACRELKRVLAPGGALFVVTPGHSRLLDLVLRVMTGEDPEENYGDRRQRLIPTLREHFRVDAQRVYPPVVGRIVPVYHALRLG